MGHSELASIDDVLTRCVTLTGSSCGAAYLVVGHGSPVLQSSLGFAGEGSPVDFFGEPGLLLEAIAGDKEIVRLPCRALDRRRTRAVLARAGLPSLLIAPVREGPRLLGAFVLGRASTPMTSVQQDLIAEVAEEMGQRLARLHPLSSFSRARRPAVERLVRAATMRDEETASHTDRVSRYSALLALLHGLGDRRAELIGAASRLHDIGKVAVPGRILQKPGALSGGERALMQRHAEYGRRMLAGRDDHLLELASRIAWTHHERWDGDGYPRGLTGEGIPLEGRIVAIADVFDAITSDRVYRSAMPVSTALGLMAAGRGTHFDPGLLDLFTGAIRRVVDIRRGRPELSPAAAGEPAASSAIRRGRSPEPAAPAVAFR